MAQAEPFWRRVWQSRPVARTAALAVALLVAWASLSPRSPNLGSFSGADKVGHAVAYLVLASVWGHALRLGGMRRAGGPRSRRSPSLPRTAARWRACSTWSPIATRSSGTPRRMRPARRSAARSPRGRVRRKQRAQKLG